MTETQLSRKLGLTKAAVGYHLHLLEEAGLIYIERMEAEKHGILQKYYSPTAAAFIVNPKKIPKDLKAYFIQTQIQFLRGLLSKTENEHEMNISSGDMEKLALSLLGCLKEVGEKHVGEAVAGRDAEEIRMSINIKAVKTLKRQKRWARILGK